MENKNKRKIMIVIILVAVLLVSIVGTYAYFTSGINNDKAQSAVLKTGSMALTFEDNDAGINEKLMFGESVVKKFKIINTGTLEASLSLDFDQMINTYLNGSLSYKLSYSSEEDGEYEEIIPETNMPVSSEPLTQTLAQELSVPAGDTYYYNLTITLNVTDFDQTDDRDAVYNTRFSVGDPIKYRYYSLTVDPNGGSWGEYTSLQEYLLKNKETLTITNIPTRVGYTFLGWKLTGVSSSFDDDTFTMGIGDSKLVAQWNINKHTVTINKNGEITTIETEYGKTIDLGEPPYKEGYTFTGWESTGGLIEGNNLTITEDKDITVTPTYIINRYKYIVYHNKQNINDEEYTLVGADTDEGEADYNSTVSPEVKTYTGFTSPTVKSLTIKH
ncbi:MAG TPA: hypothetical protein DCY94_05160, partial [Firmicutes bacterium]|nr:hypothetical protein [Bacillota bacterium]